MTQRTLDQIPAHKFVNGIPSWTSEAERECLAALAKEVKAGGLIVEIGALYGAITSVLAMNAPDAQVTTIDRFKWSPLADFPLGSVAISDRLARLGVCNVKIVDANSVDVGKTWTAPIDLLVVDGDHHYAGVKADLENFGPHAQVIAAHDYGNDAWPGVKQAVDEFLSGYPEWMRERVVNMLAVLRRVAG
jgi:precorrin-6B methylase 2